MSSSCSSQATIIRVKKKLNEKAEEAQIKKRNNIHRQKSSDHFSDRADDQDLDSEKLLKTKLIKKKQHLLRALLKERQMLSQETKRQIQKELNSKKCLNESYFSDNFDFERSKQRLIKHKPSCSTTTTTTNPTANINQRFYQIEIEDTTLENTTVNSSSCTDLTMTANYDDHNDSFNSFSHMSKHLSHFVSSQSLATNMNKNKSWRDNFCYNNNSNNRLQPSGHFLVKAHSCKNLYKKGGKFFFCFITCNHRILV